MDHFSDIDISLLDKNLELTPDERIAQHQAALDLVWEIQKAREQLNEKPKQAT